MKEQSVQLKIVLMGSNPKIWRRILVKSSVSLFELHHTIQIAMGWENYHLFEFKVDNYRIGEPNDDFDMEMGSRVIDARNIKVSEILPGTQKFLYEYDFGDAWLHEITIEGTKPIEKDAQYPFCLEGEMNAPPEDCGGIPGFYDLLGILKNKKHPQYKDMLEWLGGTFDPLDFNQKEVNLSLKKIDEIIAQEFDQEAEQNSYEEDMKWENWEEDEDDDEEDYFDMFPELLVRVVNKSKHPLPEYESEGSAGLDLRANLAADVVLKPLERTLVKTGLFIELPLDCEAQVRPRSGLALKNGITVLNSPGTIDADYRGEIGVILINLSNEDFTIKDGDRIAQMVFARHERIEWEEVKKLGETKRGEGGFGSTGK